MSRSGLLKVYISASKVPALITCTIVCNLPEVTRRMDKENRLASCTLDSSFVKLEFNNQL